MPLCARKITLLTAAPHVALGIRYNRVHYVCIHAVYLLHWKISQLVDLTLVLKLMGQLEIQ